MEPLDLDRIEYNASQTGHASLATVLQMTAELRALRATVEALSAAHAVAHDEPAAPDQPGN